jgi:hypothetical protein
MAQGLALWFTDFLRDRGLVSRDAKGEVEAVRYEAINAMLLNEFLKEHRKVEELEANAARQQK